MQHGWWPTVTFGPISMGQPSSTCSTLPSWMLVPRRIRMASLSPRMETCDQMLTPASSVTLPMMSALSAT